ncbi:hypothetical protein KBY55_09400 [Streptomyces sp. b94]|uniref:hypothetical protein n=1 Tax=Streptomyces sp. b94 TaxID=1827634 RepID=UPI001B3785C2|nr:hypothetical protein [Streptomyces sp. b94]MBQ1096298.1 hypothetical protein [Streptomyces sp. b94]
MGNRLVTEVMDMAPATLTHREAWVLAVLAADAHDDTRTTQSSVEAPAILLRARVSRPQMYAVLKALIAKGVLKRAAAGQRNQAAAYTLLPLDAAPQPAPDRTAPAAPRRLASPPRPARKRTAPSPPADTGFDEFWAAYPRKVAKGTARGAWAKALKRGISAEHITAAATRAAAQWRAAHTELRFIPHPATWLNGERYDDEPEPTPAQNQPPLPGTARYTDPSEKGIF